jgi:hypothetical protein
MSNNDGIQFDSDENSSENTFPSVTNSVQQTQEIYNSPVFKGVKAQIQLANNLNERMNQSYQPIFKSLERVQETTKLILETVKNLEESISLTCDYMGKAAKVMETCHWFLLYDLPVSAYVEIVEHEGELNEETLSREIVEFYNCDECKLLSQVVNAWKVPQFQDRMEVFKDALWAHKRGCYTLTVPTLVLHVEGIIRDFMESNHDCTSYMFKKVKEEFKKKIKKLDSVPKDQKPTPDDIRQIRNYHNLRILEDTVYKNFDPAREPEPDWINRHAITHRCSLKYTNVKFSTWLFLLLDMIHSMLEKPKTEN